LQAKAQPARSPKWIRRYCAFNGDGFYGIGGDGEETHDPNDAESKKAEGNDDLDQAEG
jgi:hypothetical protein